MPHYLVAGILPDNFDPSTLSEETVHNINMLNDELEAAGARLVAAGLSAPSQAKSLRAQPNGEVLITDGPYLEAKEHVGGFTILEAADMDEALAWGRKAAVACLADRPHCVAETDGRSHRAGHVGRLGA
jgi:hypothetical protein